MFVTVLRAEFYLSSTGVDRETFDSCQYRLNRSWVDMWKQPVTQRV